MKKTHAQKLIAILIIGLLMMGGWESCKKDDNDGPQEREKTEDTTSKIFNFVYSETEDYVRNLPDETNSKPMTLSQTDSLNFDKIAQEFLSEVLSSTLTKRGTGYEEQFEDDVVNVINSGSHIFYPFDSPYTIEYQHWDAGDWGIAHWGNFETYVKVIPYGTSKIALVILYKPQGFMQDGDAYIKLCSATYGKVLAHIPFKANNSSNIGDKIKGQYIVIPYTLEGNDLFGTLPLQKLINNKVSFIDLCPVIISKNGTRSYDNSIYIQSKNALQTNNVAVNGVDILPGAKECEFICAKYINTIFSLNRTEWWLAKDWPKEIKYAEERFDVYDNNGEHQVREGDILCFAPEYNDDGHVGIVIKIDPTSATIAHSDNNDYKWNTRLVVKNKIVYSESVDGNQCSMGNITHIIRKSSQYDDYYTYSVSKIVIDNLQHINQGQTLLCNAYAYVIAASTFAHVLDGNNTNYNATKTKAEAVYEKTGKKMRNAWLYCNNNDNSFLTAKYVNNDGGHCVKDEKVFKSFLESELSKNRIVIVDMKGDFEHINDNELYSDDYNVNPDLSSNPKYFKGTGSGHVLGVLSFKKNLRTGDGIIAYYDSYAKTRDNNIRYVSYENFRKAVANAESTDYPGWYDAYSVGLKDGLTIPPHQEDLPIFNIQLSKTDDILVGDKLELSITSDQIRSFEIEIDGEVISSGICVDKVILPTKTAKTYSGVVRGTLQGEKYEKLFTYTVKDLRISFDGKTEVNVEDALYVKIKTTTTCTIEILDDFDDVIDKKTSTKEWDYKVDTKTWGYKELKVRATDDISKKYTEATFEYEVSAIQVPNVSESKPTITVSSIAKNGKESTDDFQLTLKPNKTINPYYKSSYVGDGYFRFEKSSGNLNESGTTIAIMVVEGDSPSDLKNIKSNQIVGQYTDKDGTNWAKTYCFDRTEFTSSRSFYIIIVDSDSADGDGYYLGPLELAPVK